MRKPKIIHCDMDDVIADFSGKARDSSGIVHEHMMWDEKFFLSLEPIPGAKGAIFDLIKLGFDVHILSQPLVDNPESYIDKAKWIQLHFPQLYKKITLTQDKGLVLGDYLIDDNAKKWQEKFEQNGGKFIHFKYGGYNGQKYEWDDPIIAWRKIVEFFKKEDIYKE